MHSPVHQPVQAEVAANGAELAKLKDAEKLADECDPSPYTLHPEPYTLHPTPYTLQPTPYTLHPTPYTLHPEP